MRKHADNCKNDQKAAASNNIHACDSSNKVTAASMVGKNSMIQMDATGHEQVTNIQKKVCF